MSRLSYYKIENGFYLIPTIEIYWEKDKRIALCFMWLNRDITLWLRKENKKDRVYASRNPIDPFGEDYSFNKSAAEEQIKFPRR